MLVSVLLFVFWAVLVPFIIGLLFTGRNGYGLAAVLPCGYAVSFAYIYIVALVGIWIKMPLHVLVYCYAVISLVLFIVSLIKNRKLLLDIPEKIRGNSVKQKYLLIIPIVLIIAQTAYVSAMEHVDDDDAWYVAAAEVAVKTDTIMEYSPYDSAKSFEELGGVPDRYVLSPFPAYMAVMAKLTGIKPVIYAHTFYSIIMIPIGYMVCYLYAGLLFKKNLYACKAVFMTIAFVVTQFSGYSVYTQGVFFLTRLWQGKATLAAVFLPFLLFWHFQPDTRRDKGYTLMLLSIMLGCCLLSQMGIMLGAILTGLAAVTNYIFDKNIRRLIEALLVCIPNAALSLIYLVML